MNNPYRTKIGTHRFIQISLKHANRLHRVHATEIDFSGIWLGSSDGVEALFRYLPRLERVILCDCGIPNEELDALNRRYEDIRVIWRVYFANYSLRTDATSFIAAAYEDGADIYNWHTGVFKYLTDMQGQVEETVLRYIIRDHDMEKFEEKKDLMVAAACRIDEKYGAGTVQVALRDSYYNMKNRITPCMYIIERAEAAMRKVGMMPRNVPIRGGTDGARLSYMGLPCPNLCTGGENFHGRFEYIPVEDMEKCVDMLVEIIKMDN